MRNTCKNCGSEGHHTANCTSGVGSMVVKAGSMKKDTNSKKDSESVDHPSHYGGKNNVYEAIKVIEAWGLGFCLGNTVKYISRAGKKDPAKELEDLRKASWYLNREIQKLENKNE